MYETTHNKEVLSLGLSLKYPFYRRASGGGFGTPAALSLKIREIHKRTQ